MYALVRGDDALGRISESFKARGLNAFDRHQTRAQKIIALSTNDFAAPWLGLKYHEYDALSRSASLIIHAAWPVNFNIALASFEPQIEGLQKLLQLASDIYFPARVIFISSVSTAFNMPQLSSVPEGPLGSFEYAVATGYGRAKLVGERICEIAGARGIAVGVLRVGQISADSVNGIWNEKEHVPLLVRSATEVKALPRLYGQEGHCEWMPVDTVAATVREIAGKLTPGTSFYNIVPPHSFSWNDQFLPALREAGLKFDEVEFPEWLKRLRARADELGPAAEKKMPAIKLADYYEATYTASAAGHGSKRKYENTRACNDSVSLRYCPQLSDVGIVRKMLQYWLRHESGT